MKDKIMNAFLKVATFLSTQKYLAAIKNGFAGMTGMVIIGSFCTLIANVVCNDSPGYVSIANLPGMSWLSVLKPIFTSVNYGTMNFMTIFLIFLIAMEIGKTYDIKHFELGLVAIGSYISICLTKVDIECAAAEGGIHTIANVLSQDYTNASGLFVGMFVAIISAEIYCKLVKGKKLEIKLPDSVPENVAHSFAVLLPAAVTMLCISTLGFIFEKITGMTIFSAIVTFIQAPVSKIITGLPGYLFIIFLISLLWFFGIHGVQTLSPIILPSLLASFAQNEAAYSAGEAIPNIICLPFRSNFGIITGCGVTGGLLIAIMLFSKREDYRSIAKLSLPCALFNINEPVIFGLPIVFNPILGIPFMIAPVVTGAFAYFMTTIGFCERMVVNTPWSTPPVIMGFLAGGGSVKTAITQILCIAIATLIYTPFVLLANRQKPVETEE